VHEHSIDLGNDHLYFLKATLPPADATAYIATSGFAIHTPARAYTDSTVWLS
jgi:hypothetical protein